MKIVEYRIQYTGATSASPNGQFTVKPGAAASYAYVTVQALNINTGLVKALRKAIKADSDPAAELWGGGICREIGAIEFWQVKS